MHADYEIKDAFSSNFKVATIFFVLTLDFRVIFSFKFIFFFHFIYVSDSFCIRLLPVLILKIVILVVFSYFSFFNSTADLSSTGFNILRDLETSPWILIAFY